MVKGICTVGRVGKRNPVGVAVNNIFQFPFGFVEARNPNDFRGCGINIIHIHIGCETGSGAVAAATENYVVAYAEACAGRSWVRGDAVWIAVVIDIACTIRGAGVYIPGVTADITAGFIHYNQKQIVGTIVCEWGSELESIPSLYQSLDIIEYQLCIGSGNP